MHNLITMAIQCYLLLGAVVLYCWSYWRNCRFATIGRLRKYCWHSIWLINKCFFWWHSKFIMIVGSCCSKAISLKVFWAQQWWWQWTLPVFSLLFDSSNPLLVQISILWKCMKATSFRSLHITHSSAASQHHSLLTQITIAIKTSILKIINLK